MSKKDEPKPNKRSDRDDWGGLDAYRAAGFALSLAEGLLEMQATEKRSAQAIFMDVLPAVAQHFAPVENESAKNQARKAVVYAGHVATQAAQLLGASKTGKAPEFFPAAKG